VENLCRKEYSVICLFYPIYSQLSTLPKFLCLLELPVNKSVHKKIWFLARSLRREKQKRLIPHIFHLSRTFPQTWSLLCTEDSSLLSLLFFFSFC